MPHQVATQRPLVASLRFPQVSPSCALHSDDSVHSLALVNESRPWNFETASSTLMSGLKAFWYFIAGESLVEPSQRWLMLSS